MNAVVAIARRLTWFVAGFLWALILVFKSAPRLRWYR